MGHFPTRIFFTFRHQEEVFFPAQELGFATVREKGWYCVKTKTESTKLESNVIWIGIMAWNPG